MENGKNLGMALRCLRRGHNKLGNPRKMFGIERRNAEIEMKSRGANHG